MNKITEAKPLDNHWIHVQFDNGKQGYFDLKPYLHLGVFKRFVDQDLFRQLYVDYGTIVWPDEIDIAPSTIEADLQAEIRLD